MNLQSRQRLSARDLIMVAAIGSSALVIASALLVADIRIAQAVGGGRTFFAMWEGARKFLVLHEAPYGPVAAPVVGNLPGGRSPGATPEPYFLTIPFFLVPFYFPIALVSDWALARGLWILLGQAALVGSAFLSLALTGWRVPRRFLVAYVLLAVFGFYPAMALQEGTAAVILALIYPLMLWSFSNGHDELAGALMVMSLCAWEIGLAFLLFFLLRVIREKRWRVLSGFGMTFTVLTAISFLLYPDWVLPFLTATAGMARSSHGFTLASVLRHLYPTKGDSLALGIAIGAACLLVYEWASAGYSDYRRLLWTFCLALAVMPLIGLRTDIGQLVAIGPAFALVSAAALDRTRLHVVLGVMILVIAFVLPWGLFFRSYLVNDARAQDILALLYPAAAIAGLYWTRWWFLHPQGTWFDRARKQEAA
jgi:hypothetical protein